MGVKRQDLAASIDHPSLIKQVMDQKRRLALSTIPPGTVREHDRWLDGRGIGAIL
jgi:hypothetical protein